MSLLLTVDPGAPVPLWQQIVSRVKALVEEGALVGGDRLPPTRVLAGQLGVNRSTVCRAYEELWALGLLQSRQGSYSTIRGRTRGVVDSSRPAGRAAPSWDRLSSPASRGAYRAALALPRLATPGPGAIDFARLSADPDLCPLAEVRRAVRQVLVEDGKRVLDYADPAGFRPLRETLARRMRAHGIRVTADEILLTNGAQQALDLSLRLLGRPGAHAAIEVPTYGLLLPLLRLAGTRPLEIPMTDAGMDLDVLERRLKRRRPALLYTVPNFQNPTGITTGQAHRERLLSLCEAHGVPVVEDGFEEDMKYFGRAVLPIKSMDASGLVVYVGTFSKVVFPGLRVGWIAADRECVRRLALLARAGSLSGNTLAQAAVDRFCAGGRYDAYLRRLHAEYRRRMTALLKGLAAHVPEGAAEWTRPAGGCTSWLTVKGAGPRQEAALVQRCRAAGVAVTPGSVFFPSPPRGLHLRLSIARVKAHDIGEGCRRLGRAIAAAER